MIIMFTFLSIVFLVHSLEKKISVSPTTYLNSYYGSSIKYEFNNPNNWIISDNKNSVPNYHERLLHDIVNIARIDPQGYKSHHYCGFPHCKDILPTHVLSQYTSMKPLWMHAKLSFVARSHCDDYANNCPEETFISRSCIEEFTFLERCKMYFIPYKVCSWEALFAGSNPAERIEKTFSNILCDNEVNVTLCAFDKSNRDVNRKNFFLPTQEMIGVGVIQSSYNNSETYVAFDLSESDAYSTEVNSIYSGIHFFPENSSSIIRYMATFNNPSIEDDEDFEINVIIDAINVHEMVREMGNVARGHYIWDAFREPTNGCHSYYFEACDIKERKCWRYPQVGVLYTYMESSTCDKMYSLEENKALTFIDIVSMIAGNVLGASVFFALILLFVWVFYKRKKSKHKYKKLSSSEDEKELNKVDVPTRVEI